MYLYVCIFIRMYLIYNVCFPGSLHKSVSSYHPLVLGVLGREMKRERKAEANARVEDSIGQERPAGWCWLCVPVEKWNHWGKLGEVQFNTSMLLPWIMGICTSHTLWLCQNCYWKWPFIVDFPMKNGGSFHSFLCVYQRVSWSSICLVDPDCGYRPCVSRRTPVGGLVHQG